MNAAVARLPYDPTTEVPAEEAAMWAIRAIARNVQRAGTLTAGGVVADCADWQLVDDSVDPADLRRVFADLAGSIAGAIGDDPTVVAEYVVDDVHAAIGADDGPSLQERWAPNERVAVMHPFSNRCQGVGTVVGYRDGYVDTGGPESGPGPVVEAELVVVLLDATGGGRYPKIVTATPDLLDTVCPHDTPGHVGCGRCDDEADAQRAAARDDGRYGVTNAATAGYAYRTDDRAAADRCADAIRGTVIDTQADDVTDGARAIAQGQPGDVVDDGPDYGEHNPGIVLDDDDDETGCPGHDALERDPHAGIGETYYCDGSCQAPTWPQRAAAQDDPRGEGDR